jgi:two-component sensor histidine kinase
LKVANKKERGVRIRLKGVALASIFLIYAFFTIAQDTRLTHKIDSLLELLNTEKSIANQYRVTSELANLIENGYLSIKYAKQALALAIILEQKDKIADSYIFVGNDYERMNQFPEASKAILNAAKVYEEINNKNGYGNAMNILGTLYLKQKLYYKAVYYYNTAIKLNVSDKKHPLDLAAGYNNLGEAYRLQGTYDSALYYFKKAKAIYSQEKYDLGVAYSIGNIGLVFAAKGNREEAQNKITEATTILTNQGDYYPISVFNTEMAALSLREGNAMGAIKLASRGFAIAKKEGLKEQMRDAALVLKQAYLTTKHYDSAMHYQTEYYANKDSLVNEETIRKIADLQTQYEVSKKEDQLTKLTAEHEQSIKIAIALAIVVISIGVLSFYLWSFNNRLKAANKKQEQQKLLIEQSLKEKEVLLKEIHHRVKNNLQIISSLLNLQSNTLDDSEVLQVFQTGQSRIQSIALIHQKLYQNEQFSSIKMDDYLALLGQKVIDTLLPPDVSITLNIQANGILLDIDTAVPLALVINEMLTNTAKYAFTEQKSGQINIAIEPLEEHRYKLHYADTGPGIPEDKRLEATNTLGSRLIKILTRQLGGNVEQFNENGAHYVVRFYDMANRTNKN